MKDYWRWIRLLLKFGLPLYLIMLPVLALYGAAASLESAQALRRQEPGQTPVLLGYSSQSRYSNASQYALESHTFILFPQVLHRPKVITLARENSGALKREDSIAGFVLLVLSLAISTTGTWWFWFRSTPGRPPNNSSKPTPLRGAA